jgi:hypothetical protein
VTDRHVRVLRGLAVGARKRLRANRAERHADGSPGAARGDELARASALAEARLAAASARRTRPSGGGGGGRPPAG